MLAHPGWARESAPVTGRVVSLAPGVTEVLYAMGVQQRIAGVTEACDYPVDALSLPHVGKFMSPEVEKIAALRPAACIGLTESTPPRLIDQLGRLDIPVLTVRMDRLHELLDCLPVIGRYLGVEDAAQRLRQEYLRRLDRVKAKVADLPRPRVLTIISVNPLFCAGPKTFIADVIRVAGGVPISLGQTPNWQGLSRETVLCLKPDIILFAAHEGTLPKWLGHSPVKAITVIPIHPSLLIRPGPRLMETIEMLADRIH